MGEHLIQVTCSLSSLYSVLAFSLSSAWKQHQNQNLKQNLNHNLKQNLNHNLKQNLNHFPLFGTHHTLVAIKVLIQGPGIGMDSHLPEVIIHGKGMDPHFTSETEEIEKNVHVVMNGKAGIRTYMVVLTKKDVCLVIFWQNMKNQTATGMIFAMTKRMKDIIKLVVIGRTVLVLP